MSFTHKRMNKIEWDFEDIVLTKEAVDQRIKTCISYRSWQHTIKIINKLGISFDKLKVAEVGCGTGTFSLGLCLMGASVTLIDFNQRVLEKTKRIYELYGCRAKFIKADCLNNPSQELLGTFDFVVSGGLVEHFMGKDREKCIVYHKRLLRKGGIAYIGVPNRFSPFYQWIRLFRKLTGTWRISVEIPFSDKELMRLAEKVGFRDFYVLGNASLSKDFIVYSRGFISAIIDILPKTLRENIRKMKDNKKKKVEKTLGHHTSEDIIKHSLNDIKSISSENNKRLIDIITNKFSAGLILFAFK